MSDDSKPSTIEEALSPLQTSLIPRIARITEVSKQKTLSDDTGAQSTVAEAHENVCKAGAALAQRGTRQRFRGGPRQEAARPMRSPSAPGACVVDLQLVLRAYARACTSRC